MTNRDKMFQALRDTVFPYLQAKGYEGAYPHFRRHRKDVIELISFATDKSGGAFGICVSVAFPKRKHTNLSWCVDIDAITAFHTIDRYPGMGQFKNSGYFYSDVFRKRTQQNWWTSWHRGVYTSYACALQKKRAQELLADGYECITSFTDDTPMELCNLILRQFEDAFLWMEKFDKKNRRGLKGSKLQPLKLTKPDALVTVSNSRSSKKPFDCSYRACSLIKRGYMTTSCLQTLDGGNVEYGTPARCYVNFLSPEVYPHTLWPGRVLGLYEGERQVGTMTVLEIYNRSLDRDAFYQSEDAILANTAVLNTALQQALCFGPEMKIPLDVRLMDAIAEISGSDIKRVSQYIEALCHDILDNIYYPNWDPRKQELTVDANGITKEKYPWLSESSLDRLDRQGRYIAWRG